MAAFSYPLLDATFTYAYRATAGSWSSEIVVTRGINEPDDNFVSPVCDELRFTCTPTTSATIDRVHVCGLSIATGLSFVVTGTGSLYSAAQKARTYPERTNRETIRFTADTNTSFTFTITGIGQQSLDIRQIMFATKYFEPTYNFQNESPLTLSPRYISGRTGGTNHQRLDDETRTEVMNFRVMTNADYKKLNYMIKQKTVNGFCLIETDTDSDDIEDSFLGYINLGNINRVNDTNSFDVSIMEKYAQ